MDFQASLKPLVVISKVFGLFLVDSEEDRKQIPWIFPMFIYFIYCFYENRLSNSYLLGGELNITTFVRDYGSAYSGLSSMIVIYGHNFIARRKIKGLIQSLTNFEMKYFYFGVEKGGMRKKLMIFCTAIAFTWITDSVALTKEYGFFDNTFYLGYTLPVFLNFCCSFFQTELLNFTRNNFREINLRLSELGGFDTNQVLRLSEAHFQLLRITRDENFLFSVPIIIQLVHVFCVYILMFGSFFKSIFVSSTFEVEIIQNVNYLKWSLYFFLVWWYVLRTWVLLTQEVS